MKKLFLLTLLATLCACGSDDAPAGDDWQKTTDKQSQEQKDDTNKDVSRPADTYVYPVTQGTAEWDALWKEGDWSAVDKANQIPESTLSAMSTGGVLQSVIDFPGAAERVFNKETTYLEAFLNMIPSCNAYAELTDRQDAGEAIVNYFNGLDDSNISSHVQKVPLEEQLLAQEAILSKLSESEMKKLIELQQEQMMKNSASSANVVGTDINYCFFFARLMDYHKYQPFLDEMESNADLKSFVEEEDKNVSFESSGLFSVIMGHITAYASSVN